MPTKNKNEPLVLVVDDFADAREMYGEYLKFCGFRVAEAQNGVEAIDKAKRLKPDLILMDLSMPLIDGWEATRRLKADGTGHPRVADGHACGHSERKRGCDVIQAVPAHDLISRFAVLRPKLGGLFSMPVVDGWEATRRLKADASTKGIPVVALTGHAMAGHSESAKSAGCDVVITKPCLPHDLIKEIKKVIGSPSVSPKKRTTA